MATKEKSYKKEIKTWLDEQNIDHVAHDHSKKIDFTHKFITDENGLDSRVSDLEESEIEAIHNELQAIKKEMVARPKED